MADDCKESLEFHACSSSAQDTSDENSMKIEESNMKLFETAYKSIFDELVEDATWELCFEVHKSIRSDYFFLEDPERRKHQLVEDAEKDIFGQALKSKVQTFQISCPICIKKSCATKFASHLAKCIGISGRNSSRAANKKIAAANLYSSDLDENDFDSDCSFNSNRKRSKKNQSKKNSRRKPKIQGNSFSKSSSEINANYQEMTYEKRKAFFNQPKNRIPTWNVNDIILAQWLDKEFYPAKVQKIFEDGDYQVEFLADKISKRIKEEHVKARESRVQTAIKSEHTDCKLWRKKNPRDKLKIRPNVSVELQDTISYNETKQDSFKKITTVRDTSDENMNFVCSNELDLCRTEKDNECSYRMNENNKEELKIISENESSSHPNKVICTDIDCLTPECQLSIKLENPESETGILHDEESLMDEILNMNSTKKCQDKLPNNFINFPSVAENLQNHFDIFSTDGHNKEEPEGTITVIGTNGNKNKKNYCPYCLKSFSKLPRHMESAHPDVDEIRNISEAHSLGEKKKRAKVLYKLKNLGNHIHNSKVLRENTGSLIVVYRPPKNAEVDPFKYIPCTYCLGYFSCNEIWKHKCPLRKHKMNKKRIVTAGRNLLPVSTKINENVREILDSMRPDVLTNIVRSDQMTSKNLKKKNAVKAEEVKSSHNKRAWSVDEKKAVFKHLEHYILEKKLPGADAIRKCIAEEPSLKQRNWRNIKDFCRNRITTINKNMNS